MNTIPEGARLPWIEWGCDPTTLTTETGIGKLRRKPCVPSLGLGHRGVPGQAPHFLAPAVSSRRRDAASRSDSEPALRVFTDICPQAAAATTGGTCSDGRIVRTGGSSGLRTVSAQALTDSVSSVREVITDGMVGSGSCALARGLRAVDLGAQFVACDCPRSGLLDREATVRRNRFPLSPIADDLRRGADAFSQNRQAAADLDCFVDAVHGRVLTRCENDSQRTVKRPIHAAFIVRL